MCNIEEDHVVEPTEVVESAEVAEQTEEDLIDTLRLTLIPGVGPRMRQALLERFGSARAVLAAAPSELQSVRGVGPKLMRKITADAESIDVRQEIATCREHGIEIVTQSHPQYPRLMHEIHDPPGVVFVRGSLKPQDAMAVGIVGTRHASRYGLRQAERHEQPHLGKPFEGCRPRIRDLMAVPLRGEIAQAQPAVVMGRADEAIEVEFHRLHWSISFSWLPFPSPAAEPAARPAPVRARRPDSRSSRSRRSRWGDDSRCGRCRQRGAVPTRRSFAGSS